MGNLITEKRGLLIILIIATVLVFIGVLWAIATYLPLYLPVSAIPTNTADAPRVNENCASPVGYWINHPEVYPDQLVIGDKIYRAAELKTALSDQNDISALLQSQLISAYLNILMGSEQSYIQTTIFSAYAWLVAHPIGSQVEGGNLEEGKRLLNLLEAYNLGMTGVPACKSAAQYLATKASEEVEKVTETPTITPSETDALLPSETSTSTEDTPTATFEFIQPTRAATQTPKPPIQYPTNTPVPPTVAPKPTNTQRPPDTATVAPPPATPTFTLPPPPTATYTLPPP
jgi:hypothetical protein